MSRKIKEPSPESSIKHVETVDTTKNDKEICHSVLIEKSTQLSNVLKHVSKGLIILDSRLRFVFIDEYAKMLLFLINLDDKLIGKELREVFSSQSVLFYEFTSSFQKQIPVQFEYPIVYKKNKQILCIEIYPHKEGVFAFLHEVTNKKIYKNSLINDDFDLTCFLDKIPDGIYVLDQNWCFVYLNSKAGEFFSRVPGKLIGSQIWQEFPHISGTIIEETYKKSVHEQIFLSFETKELIPERWFEQQIFPYKSGLFIYFNDITERKRLEAEIFRLDRLNSVGEMAASIGHEIRNPMTTVRGFLQILGEKEECQKYKESFSLMIEELDRCNSIITEFLSFAVKREKCPLWCNLSLIIEAVRPLILADAAITDKNVVFELSPIPDLLLDPNEIRQLILNFTRNGLEAMEPGKTLLINTFLEDNQVVLMIKDQGSGIDQSIIDRIGTPFLTTKKNGTGLGLAVCYRIAAHNNAVISYKTGREGTTFFICFNKTID